VTASPQGEACNQITHLWVASKNTHDWQVNKKTARTDSCIEQEAVLVVFFIIIGN